MDMFEWFMEHLFFKLTGLLCLGFIIFVVALFVGPINDNVPVPLDVCAGTQLHVVEQGNVLTQDYIDLRGNTVYLVWHVSRVFIPELNSKQVIKGDLCHS